MNFNALTKLGPITDDETVARYICHSKYLSGNGKVKTDVFRERREGVKISVYRTDGLTDEQIWILGKERVALRRQRNLYGRADISVFDVKNTNLGGLDLSEKRKVNQLLRKYQKQAEDVRVDIEPSEENNERHAEITYEPFEKSIEKHIAKKLARESRKFLPSSAHVTSLGLHSIRS